MRGNRTVRTLNIDFKLNPRTVNNTIILGHWFWREKIVSHSNVHRCFALNALPSVYNDYSFIVLKILNTTFINRQYDIEHRRVRPT